MIPGAAADPSDAAMWVADLLEYAYRHPENYPLDWMNWIYHCS